MPKEITQSSAGSAGFERPTAKAELKVVLVDVDSRREPVLWVPRRQSIIARSRTAIVRLIRR